MFKLLSQWNSRGGWNRPVSPQLALSIVLAITGASAAVWRAHEWYIHDRIAPNGGVYPTTSPSHQRAGAHKLLTPDVARTELHTTAEQQRRVEQLYNDTKRRRSVLREKLRAKMVEHAALFGPFDIDRAHEAQLRAEIVQLHSDLLQVQLDNETQLRQILTREQIERLRTISHNRLNVPNNVGIPGRILPHSTPPDLRGAPPTAFPPSNASGR